MSYFLINWDLIRFAKHKGFFHVGRGSGANSLVAYCLGITDVDPIELDLYFERFINPSRSSPPDFDLDFSWKDRDHVTQYLFDKYGAERRVALLATYSTYQRRAVIRELGKVFGLPPDDIDALANEGRMHSQWVGRQANAMDKSAGPVVEHDRIVRTIMRYSERFIEHPHHLSIHVGGVLVGKNRSRIIPRCACHRKVSPRHNSVCSKQRILGSTSLISLVSAGWDIFGMRWNLLKRMKNLEWRMKNIENDRCC